MPTKTRSPSWISRDATAISSSCSVNDSLIAEVGLSRVLVVMDANRVDVDAVQVRRPVGHVQHPALQPTGKAILGPRLLRVVAVERVVALEMSLNRRGVRASRFMNDGDHLRLRQEDAIRIGQGDVGVDKLLAGDD